MLKIWGLGAATLLALCTAGTARAEWREVETAHFRIYSEGKEKDVVQYAERLEAVHYLMKIATGMKDDKPVNKVDVYYVYSVDELRRVLDAKPNSSVAGIYIPSIRGSAAIVPRNNDGGSLDPQAVLFHEYAHHFMLQYQPGAYPPWYVEGWAELISTASFERKGTITFGKAASHRQNELEYLRWIPLRSLIGRSKEDRDVINRDYGSYYGQSWLLAHYLTLADKRPGQLRAYLLAVLRGASDEEAWKAFGDVDELEREVRAYLRGRSFPYKAPPLPPEVMAIQSSRALRPGEAAIMDERIEALHQRMDEKERADIIARAEAEAARFPDDAAVQLFLAEQYADAEDWPKSAATAAAARWRSIPRSPARISRRDWHWRTARRRTRTRRAPRSTGRSNSPRTIPLSSMASSRARRGLAMRLAVRLSTSSSAQATSRRRMTASASRHPRP
ncbi:hypothetical protein [Sphingopyxis sp. PET50]|uniref:hypothetical protein n=1 Tax=Sphingopyxis sp. PET50 TaxID=2976533 RepID=UPI0021AF4B70|nr:hypothetical protein [Sphingopyxis sp. PET50]